MMQTDRKVFVFNAYDKYGGSFMLYKLAEICYDHFGSQVFIVQNNKSKRGKARFHYNYEFPILSIYNMRRLIRKNDLFICNPSQSRHRFGSLLTAKKLMYLQGVTNYTQLDKNFDFYVSASSFVQNQTQSNYNINSHVINPFVELDLFLNEVPWQEKSDEILILNYKVNPQPLLDRLIECYQAKYTPSLPKFKIVSNLTHDEWANVLKKHKFFLNASPVEGFGLPSLEAMASGCVVLGLDSYGGRDYFESGRNSLVVPEDGVDQLADYLYELIRDPNKGVDISRNAVSTAKNFSYSNYKESWEHFLEKKVFCTV